MTEIFKFKIGDLVRPKTSSPKSRSWKVIKNLTLEESSKILTALSGKPTKATEIEVQCESFAYGKPKVKYFKQDDLLLVVTSSK